MLSKVVSIIAPSATLAITAKAKQMTSGGDRVVSFSAGQPDFDTPEIVKKAAKKALDEGFTKYTKSIGIVELREAVARKFKRDNNLEYSADQVMVSNGAKQVLLEVIFSLCEKGDEVIIPAPYWVSYPEMVKIAGATSVILTPKKGLKITPEDLERKITKKTKVLFFNAPSNPTGVIYTKKEMLALEKVLKKHDVWVVADECYDHFYYGKEMPVSFASISKWAYERTVTINAVSKSFSMTGWRIGYGANPNEKLMKALGSLQSHMSSNPCSFSQRGAVEALNKAIDFPSIMRKEFIKRRKVMVEGVNKIRGMKAKYPDGAFYVWVDISALSRDSLKFASDLLEEAKVAVIPGAPFGGEEYIRLSFACSMEDIKEGLEKINKFVEKRYG